MANNVKTYFLAPSWDYPPDGRIRLGNIITSPSRAAEPLNFTSRKEPMKDELTISDKTGVHWTREKQREGKYGVWMAFLSFMGLGVDTNFGHNNVSQDDYAFDRIDTVEFFPTEEYLAESMRDPEVLKFIEMSRLRRRVYMIVGIKTVAGAKAKTSRASGLSGQFKVTLDGTTTGTPVSLGPGVEAKTEHCEDFAFEGASDFVFAFRIREIKLTKTGDLEHSGYTRGAMLDADKKPTNEDIPFKIQGLDDYDVTCRDLGYEMISGATENNELVEICAKKN